MAIVGITPTFMSPMAFRDSAQELAQASQNNAAALRNAFKFGTQVYDYAKNRQIGNALKKGDVEKASLLESQKINQQDPSVLWRWNQGQQMQQAQIDEAKAQRADDLKKANSNLMNETQAVIKSQFDESNPSAIIQQINNLNTQKARLQNAGMDTSEIDNQIKINTDKLNAANEAIKANSARGQATAAIKEQISAGAIDSAMGMIADALSNNQINQNEADRYMALIQAKQNELAAQTRQNISSQQQFADAQEKRRKEKSRKRNY